MTFDWNEENIDLLTKRWADGASARAIASELPGDVSRNGVIGKVHRLGLAGRAPQNSAVRKRKPRTEAPPQTNCGGFMHKVKTGKTSRPRSAFVPWVNMPKCDAVEAASAPQDEPADPPTATRCSLLELTNWRCRWPCGEPGEATFAFCGAPGADLSDRRPYCAFHLARAFTGRRGHANPLSRKPLPAPIPSAALAPSDDPARKLGRALAPQPDALGPLPHSPSVDQQPSEQRPGNPTPPCPQHIAGPHLQSSE